MCTLLAALTALMLFATPVVAGQYQDAKKAADRGDAKAQYILGVMYADGDGVPEDDAKAIHWYRRAAEQGYAKAQYNLGLMYAKGEGVPEDDAKTAHWFRKAAEQGHSRAQFNLGVLYHLAKRVGQAFYWYRKAAEQGHTEAQAGLAELKKAAPPVVARDLKVRRAVPD